MILLRDDSQRSLRTASSNTAQKTLSFCMRGGYMIFFSDFPRENFLTRISRPKWLSNSCQMGGLTAVWQRFDRFLTSRALVRLCLVFRAFRLLGWFSNYDKSILREISDRHRWAKNFQKIIFWSNTFSEKSKNTFSLFRFFLIFFDQKIIFIIFFAHLCRSEISWRIDLS